MLQMKCWNEVNGCGALVSASDLLKHFDEDCMHHSTRCPKCSALILCRNVCAHRRNNCSTHVLPNEAHQQEQSQNFTPEAVFIELKVALEDGVRELRSAFDLAVRDNTPCVRLNDFSHMVNTLRETVIDTSEKQTRAVSVAKITIVRVVRDDLAAQGNRLDEVAQRIGALTENFKVVAADATKKCLNKLEEIIAEGLTALKDKAISSRWSLYESDPVYLCGYRISPGLYLQKNESSVSVHAHVRLLKGDADKIMRDAVAKGSENFDHLGFFNMHPNLSTWATTLPPPSEMQPPKPGFDPATCGSAAEYLIHLTTRRGRFEAAK
ncbi:hypothetical protein HPB51_000460 [Rhipicephalus microplus]|uniref:Uncharacterized protein n=1 Tax=Rhipicephalus microplus TaxID=6941 RepID=A0A9J6E4F4_RHIMP|nr:hypothetical protein HPB51_000460 [Rhipicephalus microplus]